MLKLMQTADSLEKTLMLEKIEGRRRRRHQRMRWLPGITDTMDYYSTKEKKKILSYATSWMKLVDILLSEITLSQKDKYRMIPLV